MGKYVCMNIHSCGNKWARGRGWTGELKVQRKRSQLIGTNWLEKHRNLREVRRYQPKGLPGAGGGQVDPSGPSLELNIDWSGLALCVISTICP